MDLDATLGEPSGRVLAEAPGNLREDLRRCIDQHPALRHAAEVAVRAERCLGHVVELGERLDAGVAGPDEHEAELGRVVRVDRCALELEQDPVAQGDRIGEILESEAVLHEAWYRERPGRRAECDDEPLVADLQLSRERVDPHDPALAIEGAHAPEDELGVWAHLPERHDDVARLERSRRGLGEERCVEHEVLARDDGCATAFQESSDVAAGEASAEDERATACLASLHGSCLPRWRGRLR